MFLDALFIAIGFQSNKSPLDFLTPDGAGRAHNFPMSNWQCDRSKCNNFKSVLPLSKLLLLDYVIENGGDKLSFVIGTTLYFCLLILKTSVAFTLNLWVSELPLPDKRRTYV